ncbi:MAG: murein biosynthesis integral membrane protein MurJ, partial [Chloroflexota bacterium]
ILSQFGTGREFEAYVAAVTVPDIIFQVLAGGAVGSAFIPVFKTYIARDGMDDGWRLARTAMTVAVAVTIPVALLFALIARPLTDLIVPGFDAELKQQTADLMRIMLVSPVLFAVSGFATSVLNSFQRFALTALAPVAYNLSIIAGAVLLRSFGVEGVAIGVAVGALLHLLVQVPGLRAQGMVLRPAFQIHHPGLREVARLMGPRMLGLGVVQINLLVNVVLASLLISGSIGYLNVAWTLIMSPLVLAMAVSTAVFPTLAEESALEHNESVRELFLLSLRMILFLTIPASVGLMVLAQPVIRLFFERGEFTAISTAMTAGALIFYSIGLAGHASVEIVDRVFYALHDTRTPVTVAVGAFVLNIVLSLGLMQTELNYRGLALAHSLAALTEAAILLWLLSRRVGGLPLSMLWGGVARIGLASAAMALTLGVLPAILGAVVPPESDVVQAFELMIMGTAGVLVYFGVSALLKSEDLGALVRLIRGRA